jgi:hypothetical protein
MCCFGINENNDCLTEDSDVWLYAYRQLIFSA